MSERTEPPAENKVSRRRLFGMTGIVTVVAGMLTGVRIQRRSKLKGVAHAAERPRTEGYRKPVFQQISLTVNDVERTVEVDTRSTLANVLREQLHLTGTHVCCDRGECGACSVLVDGRAVYSCVALAVQVQGKKVETIEGLSKDGKMHPIQEAFIECDGFQCGYCTSGQIMTLKGLIDRMPSPTEQDVRLAIAGNICRCGAYPGIIKAGLLAAEKARG